MRGKRIVFDDYNTVEIREILKLRVEESSKKLNLCKCSITTLRKHFDIPLYKQPRKYISAQYIDDFTKSLIIGMLLGDSSLCKAKYNRILSTTHSANQEGYLRFKYRLLKELGIKYFNYTRKDKRTGNTYYSSMAITKSHIWFNELYDKMYVDGRKTITKELLDMLTPQAICLWYLDDGHLRHKNGNNTLTISTNCFNDDELLLIIGYFERVHNIYFKKTTQNALIIYGKDNLTKFMSIVGKYIPRCMSYKFYGEYKNRTYAVGDIHGRYTALREVLKKAMFDYENSRIIILGDAVDGGSRTYEVVEELLKINNLIYIIGNHDEYFCNHIKSGWAEEIWLSQGGKNTINSYRLSDNSISIPVTHQEFFNRGKYWHIEDNMVFVHGGFRPDVHPSRETKETLLWDRDLIEYALYGNRIQDFKMVFVGHTTTQTYGSMLPRQYGNLMMLDTGAGFNGKLSLMDIDTLQFWQSKKQVACR